MNKWTLKGHNCLYLADPATACLFNYGKNNVSEFVLLLRKYYNSEIIFPLQNYTVSPLTCGFNPDWFKQCVIDHVTQQITPQVFLPIFL